MVEKSKSMVKKNYVIQFVQWAWVVKYTDRIFGEV